jgi:hypothetical protein
VSAFFVRYDVIALIALVLAIKYILPYYILTVTSMACTVNTIR